MLFEGTLVAILDCLIRDVLKRVVVRRCACRLSGLLLFCLRRFRRRIIHRRSSLFLLFIIGRLCRSCNSHRLIVHLELIDSVHERLELPVVDVGAAFHLILEELSELRWIVPSIDHLVRQKLLLHDSQILKAIVLLAKGVPGLLHAGRIRKKLIIIIEIVFIFHYFHFILLIVCHSLVVLLELCSRSLFWTILCWS